jgi:Tfp pilus assembly protein PilN
MHEIDLIPADYRHERSLARSLARCGWLIGALLAASIVAAGAFRHAANVARADIVRLDAAAALAEQQRAAIAALTLQKQALEARAHLEHGLRSKASLDELMTVIGGAAVDAGVWFRSWHFERLGLIVPAAPPGGEGLFVVDPNADGSLVRSDISITGRAAGVANVSALVDKLAGMPRFKQVQVQRVSRDSAEGVVDFELALAVDDRSEQP